MIVSSATALIAAAEVPVLNTPVIPVYPSSVMKDLMSV
jgi:hypothetical protein